MSRYTKYNMKELFLESKEIIKNFEVSFKFFHCIQGIIYLIRTQNFPKN